MTRGTFTCAAYQFENDFWLFIPIEPAGKNFVACAKGVSTIEEGHLKICIPGTVAESVGIRVGTRVDIDNVDGKLNIRIAEDQTSD